MLLDPKEALVVAIYDYEAQNPQELTLQYNEEYYVIDSSEEHWWLIQDKNGYVTFQQPIYKSFINPLCSSLNIYAGP